jgi:hypothetical protein
MFGKGDENAEVRTVDGGRIPSNHPSLPGLLAVRSRLTDYKNEIAASLFVADPLLIDRPNDENPTDIAARICKDYPDLHSAVRQNMVLYAARTVGTVEKQYLGRLRGRLLNIGALFGDKADPKRVHGNVPREFRAAVTQEDFAAIRALAETEPYRSPKPRAAMDEAEKSLDSRRRRERARLWIMRVRAVVTGLPIPSNGVTDTGMSSTVVPSTDMPGADMPGAAMPGCVVLTLRQRAIVCRIHEMCLAQYRLPEFNRFGRRSGIHQAQEAFVLSLPIDYTMYPGDNQSAGHFNTGATHEAIEVLKTGI